MHRLTVKLVEKAISVLNTAATTLGMEPERAFEYIVRNALTMYHVVELGGYVRFIDDKGEVWPLYFQNTSSEPTPTTKHTPSIRQPREQPTPKYELFYAFINDDTFRNITLQASVFGITETDLINQLIINGGTVAIHLRQGVQAFAFSQSDDALGKIEFTTQ